MIGVIQRRNGVVVRTATHARNMPTAIPTKLDVTDNTIELSETRHVLPLVSVSINGPNVHAPCPARFPARKEAKANIRGGHKKSTKRTTTPTPRTRRSTFRVVPRARMLARFILQHQRHQLRRRGAEPCLPVLGHRGPD